MTHIHSTVSSNRRLKLLSVLPNGKHAEYEADEVFVLKEGRLLTAIGNCAKDEADENASTHKNVELANAVNDAR